MTRRFDVGDLVQIKSEYEENGNPTRCLFPHPRNH